ncbi:MAG: hypothetical protein WDM89_21935 [Rhizomicrobium sp.]
MSRAAIHSISCVPTSSMARAASVSLNGLGSVRGMRGERTACGAELSTRPSRARCRKKPRIAEKRTLHAARAQTTCAPVGDERAYIGSGQFRQRARIDAAAQMLFLKID